MYVAYLDASKAFDRVNQNKLFKKLLNNGVPKWIINMISQWYCNQTLCVKWGSVISDVFLMYADDIVLLSPSAKGMQRLLNNAYTYTYIYSL